MNEKNKPVSATGKEDKTRFTRESIHFIVNENYEGPKPLEDILLELVYSEYCKKTSERN